MGTHGTGWIKSKQAQKFSANALYFTVFASAQILVTARLAAVWSNSVATFDVLPKNPDNVGFRGEVAEWLMAADCKSALLRVRWFESSPLHHCFTEQVKSLHCGCSSMVEQKPSKLTTTVRSRSPAPGFSAMENIADVIRRRFDEEHARWTIPPLTHL